MHRSKTFTTQTHVPGGLNKLDFCKKVPDFLLPIKSELFLCVNSVFLFVEKSEFLPKNCSGNLAARRAKSLSKANNKFEEHTLGQFTQPDFTFKPSKVNYSTFLNS